MVQRIPILLAILAWACLASPWQACASDCRDGALQAFAHACHDDGCASGDCASDHDSGDHHACDHDAGAEDREPEDDGASQPCRCGSARSQHLNLMLPQCEPEPRIEFALLGDAADEPLDGFEVPRPPIAWLDPRRVDPPGGEPPGCAPPGECRSGSSPQASRQLRITILLL